MDGKMKCMDPIRVKRKGLFFTLGIVLLMVPLLLLVSFFTSTTKTQSEDDSASMRCDELHYFVEDVKRDLSRAVEIFGRRAAIYALDYAVAPPGNPLMNYTFGCSSACNIDCNKTAYPRTGTEAAIAELALCGTLNNTNVTYMVNHTVREWVNRIEMRGEQKNFGVKLTLNEIKVVPIDAFDFSIILNNNIDIVDDTGICYYMGTSMNTMSNTSIIGLEDPLYTFNTQGAIIKYIYECRIDLNLTKVLANASNGSGVGGGKVLLYSDQAYVESYCNNASPENLNDMVLVVNQSVSCNTNLSNYTNASSQKHFGGVVNVGTNGLACSITVPYASNATRFNASNADCLLIKNGGTNHTIIAGTFCENINYSCYQPSNSSLYQAGCPRNYSNGPSFFDRLDGRTNLSETYLNQSKAGYNNSFIGLETIIDPNDMANHKITVLENASLVDYLYWNNVSANRICGTCSRLGRTLRLDCQHARKYEVNASC